MPTAPRGHDWSTEAMATPSSGHGT